MPFANDQNVRLECGNCPYAVPREPKHDDRQKLSCSFERRTPLLTGKVEHAYSGNTEYRYQWRLPEVESSDFCKDHPGIANGARETGRGR